MQLSVVKLKLIQPRLRCGTGGGKLIDVSVQLMLYSFVVRNIIKTFILFCFYEKAFVKSFEKVFI